MLELAAETIEYSSKNIFEEQTSEYPAARAQRQFASPGSSKQPPCHVVASLVRKRDYSAALAAMRDLTYIGVSIKPDEIYLDAARYAHQRFMSDEFESKFTRPDTRPNEQSDAESTPDDAEIKPASWARIFLDWWALVPRSAALEALPSFCEAFASSPSSNLDLARKFCLACAERGMSSCVGLKVLPDIIRHDRPQSSSRFLDAFESAAFDNEDDTILKGRKHRWSHWRNVAIIVHFNAGRKDLALEMYKDAIANKKHIETATMAVIRRNIWPEAPPRTMAPSSFALTRYGFVRRDRAPTISQVAAELRALRSIIRTPRNRVPFEARLADFMYVYEAIYQRRRALKSLRNWVFKSNKASLIDRWISAELLLYSSRKRPLATLRAFAHYFRAGLGDDVLMLEAQAFLKETEQWGATKIEEFDWPSSSDLYPIEHKISPSHENTSLAWQAILKLSKSPEQLDRLYNLFLNTIASAPDAPLPSTQTALTFNHFVIAFARRVSLKRGTDTLRSLQQLGFYPKIGTWGALAGAYAWRGYAAQANRILDVIERNWSIEDAKDEQTARTDRLSPSGYPIPIAAKLRRWKVVSVYNNVLLGFTKHGLFEEARGVLKRMEEKGVLIGTIDRRTKSTVKKLVRTEKGKIKVKPDKMGPEDSFQ
jgi:pentatricopeptide repeat protein